MKKKPETDRDKWMKRWFLGTPTGGGVSEINAMKFMDKSTFHSMDGTALKPMEP